jgi:hypothetical protein
MVQREPDADASSRLWMMRCVLVVAVVLGVLASWKLWVSSRLFPVVPLAAGFPKLPASWDAALVVLALVSLVASLRAKFARAATLVFLAGGLFLWCSDQNRGQPWFYLYWVMLVMLLFPEMPAMAGLRVIVSAVYVWAAVQKFEPEYQKLVVPYMTQPLARWLPAGLLTIANWSIRAAPAFELLIGIGVWVPKLRKIAIGAGMFVHLVALLLLGPLGHNYNLVVWPWNLAMIAFLVLLFPPLKLTEVLKDLRRSAGATVVVALVTLLPILSYFGWWDSYFSFALYSGNTAKADYIIVPALAERLPEPIRRFAVPLNEQVIAANPGLRGLYVYDVQSWAQAELGVPPIPEPRNYLAIGRYLARYAEQGTDLQLIVTPRRGEPKVYPASDLK